ncbi:carboxypeptidase-like regulatory domain-containing protein [Nannocystis pusilla]|uniref:Carboxypeptidase-like regulatory domain-containing protein n=1 Tax=Nannocystis pusilla TaxID=889268 RepID=A0ABS7TJR6_9BACT|nr:carboxypeptidase-like regulatory domain-containing protein [Nannocystis pusilla]MBZ5708471.1 carboxypeptidase-like regulatory domain-containing protein [Nannocystis pusilla]
MRRSLALQLAACTPYVALADGVADEHAQRPVALRGHVRRSDTGEPITGALVFIECDCLERPREVITTGGPYEFTDLPPGSYDVLMLHEFAVRRSFTAAPGERWYIGFDVPPARSGR